MHASGNIHLGITPWDWTGISSGARLAEQARTAEALGFDSFWVPESHFSGQRSVPAPLLLLAAAAAVTNDIALGCVSYLLPIRNAMLAAEEIAVLDRLCNGRLILGLGRGIQPKMFEAFEIRSGDKRKLFAERLAQIRALWHGETPIALSPLPLQQPEPRLWAAAIGPKALQQIAELGLPYLASPLESYDVLATNLEAYRAIAGAVKSTTPIMRTVYTVESQAEAERIKTALIEQLSSAGLHRGQATDETAIVGSITYVSETLTRYKEELGMTHLILRGGLPGVSAADQLASFEKIRQLQIY
ncbi:LLM class flavin-dependent oxidoreductase [Halioglobus maricola]|nr:LLM class flavin-dependent oxidoreductase [Halioglobus maricola]